MLFVEGVRSMGRGSEDEEDCDELEGERRSGVPTAEEASDGGESETPFIFLKYSSRFSISLASVVSEGCSGSWGGCASLCNLGREANVFANLRNALCDRDMASGLLSLEANPAT